MTPTSISNVDAANLTLIERVNCEKIIRSPLIVDNDLASTNLDSGIKSTSMEDMQNILPSAGYTPVVIKDALTVLKYENTELSENHYCNDWVI